MSACYVAAHASTFPPAYCVISDDTGADFVTSDLHLSAYMTTLFDAQLAFIQQNEFELEFEFYKRSSNFRKKKLSLIHI